MSKPSARAGAALSSGSEVLPCNWQTLNLLPYYFIVNRSRLILEEFVWEKPVIVFYKERLKKPERKAFAIVKARRLAFSRVEEEGNFRGSIKDFFSLMGDIDCISAKEGMTDRYVLCWFEDKEDDFSKAWRRLTGVTFSAGITFATDENGKRTYHADFRAEQGKLE